MALAPEAALPPPRESTRLSPVAYVSGGVAITALGISVVTGVLALSARSSAEDKCLAARDYCPDRSASDDASRARTLAWVSTISLGVAIAATAMAILWPRTRSRAE